MLLKNFKKFLHPYKDKLNINLIYLASTIANKSHKNQFRQSGDPYITHPLRVAKHLILYNFDTNTICAALLHDVLEDTNTTEQELIQLFGKDITNLVLGVTKLNNINFLNNHEAQIENFRKFILAFINDIRVLIIKLFDRLDNMRSIQYLLPSKQERISKETLDIYVPLASRIALNDIKDELEDICFSVLHKDTRLFLIQKIESITTINQKKLNNINKEIKKLLIKNNIKDFIIQNRAKKPYSIWKKMKKNNISFEDLFDIFGFRIIVKNTEDCYKILYILHTNYKAIFNRFKDYISNPKFNNYQSLHTCILLDNNIKIEFQIRTSEMHIFADQGIASHWNYKDPINTYDISKYAWLQNLLTIINFDNVDIEDIYEYSKLALFDNQIFVFTPKGDIINLPKESTALDFAYAIHSDIGNTCSEVYVNGLKKEPFIKLENGQKVEIITNQYQEPNAIWLSFVKTGLAKVSIKRYLNNKHNKDISQQAISILSYIFEKEGLKFFPEIINKIMEIENIKSENRLFNFVLEGKIDIKDIIHKLYPTKFPKNEINYNKEIYIQSIKLYNKNIFLSSCCYPIIEDPIVGVVLPNNTIEIHHSSCEILYANCTQNLNIIRSYWNENINTQYQAKLNLKIDNIPGAFYNISKILALNNINIKSIISNEDKKNKNIINADIFIDINNLYDLKKIYKKIENSQYVKSIERKIN